MGDSASVDFLLQMPTFMVFRDGNRIDELVGANPLALGVCLVINSGLVRTSSNKKLTEPS
jgi:hypothetical protein